MPLVPSDTLDLRGEVAFRNQGLTLVHGSAQLEHIRDTFRVKSGYVGHKDSSS
jgi:hypothetical protein